MTEFFTLVKTRQKPGMPKKVNRALITLIRARNQLLQEMQAARIDNSFLGYAGKALVPLTQWAGFNWRVNVALLGAFAAKESAVATLGPCMNRKMPVNPWKPAWQEVKKTSPRFMPWH